MNYFNDFKLSFLSSVFFSMTVLLSNIRKTKKHLVKVEIFLPLAQVA